MEVHCYKKLSNFQSYLEYFEYYIHDIVSKDVESTTGEECFANRNEILRRNICVTLDTARGRRDSDIIVKTKKSLEEVNVLHTEICQCQAIQKYLASSFMDEYGNVHVALNRKVFIKDIFGMVFQQGINYGQKQGPVESHALINCSSVNDELNVGQLRDILLCNHMTQVLKQNG